jgi:hypothetical protein
MIDQPTFETSRCSCQFEMFSAIVAGSNTTIKILPKSIDLVKVDCNIPTYFARLKVRVLQAFKINYIIDLWAKQHQEGIKKL